MPPRWSLDSSRRDVQEDEDNILCTGSSSHIAAIDASPSLRVNTEQRDIVDEESRDPVSTTSSTTSESPSSSSGLLSSTSSSSIQSSSDSLASSSPKRSVRFAEYACLYKIKKFENSHGQGENDDSVPASSSTWYSPEELRSFRNDAIQTIQCIVAGNVQENSMEYDGSNKNENDINDTDTSTDFVFCARGCEIRTPMGTAVRQRHRLDAMRAVLFYQEECKRLVHKMNVKTQSQQSQSQVVQHQQQQNGNVGNLSKTTQQQQQQPSPRIVRLTDVMDPEVVARVYAARTHQSQRQAQFMGQLDHKQVAGAIVANGMAANGEITKAMASSQPQPTHQPQPQQPQKRCQDDDHPPRRELLWKGRQSIAT